MFDAKLDKFAVILDLEVGGPTDKMAGWADAGRFQIWTRGSPVHVRSAT